MRSTNGRISVAHIWSAYTIVNTIEITANKLTEGRIFLHITYKIAAYMGIQGSFAVKIHIN